LAEYEVAEEEAETMGVQNNGNGSSGKEFTTPAGKKYECMSDCRSLFASSRYVLVDKVELFLALTNFV